MSKEFRKNEKKTYHRPEIKIIDLAADEVMAVGCKTASSLPAPTTGAFGCIPSNCKLVDGS